MIFAAGALSIDGGRSFPFGRILYYLYFRADGGGPLRRVGGPCGHRQVATAMMDVLGLMLGTVGQGALSEHAAFTFGDVWNCNRPFPSSPSRWRCFAPAGSAVSGDETRPGSRRGDAADPRQRITRSEPRSIAPVIRARRPQSLQGLFIGVLPEGGGDHTPPFSAKRWSATSLGVPNREEFGKGLVKGPRRRPETANNAACTGPSSALTLGIPGSEPRRFSSGAPLLALNRLTPGPRLMIDDRTCSGPSSSRCISATWSFSSLNLPPHSLHREDSHRFRALSPSPSSCSSR